MKKEKTSATLLFIGSSVSESGYEGDNQLYDTSSIKFYEPSSLIVTRNSILVADKSNSCIRKIDLQSKMVSTLAGGIINHPYGENISPLKMYTYGATTFPFRYKNDLYFVEQSLVIRKVSNGKMTTVFGSSKELKYPSNKPSRIFFSIGFLHHFGNGEILITGSIYLGLYVFNMETQNLTLVHDPKYYSSAITATGDSYENSTIYYQTYVQTFSVFHKSNLLYILKIDIPGLGLIRVIPDLTINGTNSLLYCSGNSIYEYIDYKNGTYSTSIRKISDISFNGFTTFGRIFYFYINSQVYEYSWDSLSLKKIVGFDAVNISNTNIYTSGFNGDDIPIETSAT